MSLLSDDLQLTNSDCKGHRRDPGGKKKKKKKRWGGTFLLDKQKEWEKKGKTASQVECRFSFFLFFFGLNYNHHPSWSQHFYSSSWLGTWQMNVGINGVSGRGGRWMFSQQGGAGEVQLALASGQSFWASCRSTHHPRGRERGSALSPSSGPLVIFPLFISKLTPCLPPAPSLPTHLRWPESIWVSIKGKKIWIQCKRAKRKKPLVSFHSPPRRDGGDVSTGCTMNVKSCTSCCLDVIIKQKHWALAEP